MKDMQPMIKRILTIILLAAGLQTGWSFALLGPLGSATLQNGAANGDSWQTASIGYELINTEAGPGGQVFIQDIGGPKNLGEGYRRNTPQVYYAYDAAFLGFFGSDGATNVDNAFAIMNSLTNVSSYSSDLSEFPDNSQEVNGTAQGFLLTDIKSETLHLLVETMGLAQPERFTWTLAERNLPTGAQCPQYDYLVVQRNFGIVPTDPTSIQYSSYVNDVLYSYLIAERCLIPNHILPDAFTVNFAVDPEAQEYTAVAANTFSDFGAVNFTIGGGLEVGSFYTGLTRDDVAGLRYLYQSNNIVTEDVAPGAQVLSTNFPSLQLVQTISWGNFISQFTNPPDVLSNLFPNLQITSVATNFTFTNVALVTPIFTNFPGPSVTNFEPPILITNIDLTLFHFQALTNGPGALQLLYPDLQIVSSSSGPFIVLTNPIVVTYLTNGGIGSPVGTVRQVTVTNGGTPIIIPTFIYTFGNILTNAFSSTTKATLQTISVSGLIGAPVGSIGTNSKSSTLTITNLPSGDIFIIPTNWCGFNLFQKLWQMKQPSFTNQLAVTNVNQFGTAFFEQNIIFSFTNRIWAVQPGVCEPALIFVTNSVGEIVTNYTYTFGNLFTNPPTMQFPNSTVTIITTNIGPCSNGVAGTLCTNVTTQTLNQPGVPSGDFFIVPPDWTCGFQIVQVAATNLVGTTNTIVITPTNGVPNIGEQFSVTTISTFTNHTLLIQPFICQLSPPVTALRQGIERVQFIRANFDSDIGQFFQPITNDYSMVKITNSQAVTEFFQRVVTQPDIVLSADNFISSSPASGVFVGTVQRTINFDSANALPGLAGPGTISGPVTFDFNKIGDAFDNGSLADNNLATNAFLSQFTQTPNIAWASFDATTNPPEVYPNGNSIANLQNQILIQVSPATLANGVNGVPYTPVVFTATGGAFTTPYTWSAANLPPGMMMASDGTLSGTPTQSGTYDVTVTLTDFNKRTVQWFYTLIIQ